jgi:hypothetical protein
MTSTRIGDVLVLESDGTGSDGSGIIVCARCAHVYGPADRDPKLGSVVREGSIGELSALNEYGLTEALVVRHFHCPQCALTIAVDLQEKGDPIMLGNRLSVSTKETA